MHAADIVATTLAVIATAVALLAYVRPAPTALPAHSLIDHTEFANVDPELRAAYLRLGKRVMTATVALANAVWQSQPRAHRSRALRAAEQAVDQQVRVLTVLTKNVKSGAPMPVSRVAEMLVGGA